MQNIKNQIDVTNEGRNKIFYSLLAHDSANLLNCIDGKGDPCYFQISKRILDEAYFSAGLRGPTEIDSDRVKFSDLYKNILLNGGDHELKPQFKNIQEVRTLVTKANLGYEIFEEDLKKVYSFFENIISEADKMIKPN